MVPDDVMKSLSVKTDSKIVVLVVDGIGGLPVNGRTELETAMTPNLDALAAECICGVTDPVSYGITPGSGPSHLAIFGYDPLRHEIGRGVLEALGVGLTMTDRDVAARGNFATLKDGIITDRRAGRIPTEKNKELCAKITEKIKKIRNAEIILEPGKEHRFTVLFRGDGLDGRIADADPQKAEKKPVSAEPLCPAARDTAIIINEFIERVTRLLKEEDEANTVLMRGFTKYPSIPSMTELFKLTPAAIATYPMYRGLARLVGMDILPAEDSFQNEIKTLKKDYADYDFFYVHYKHTDSRGEDSNFDAKVKAIEEVDPLIPEFLALKPDVFAVTSDHSTPSVLGAHSWHPNPFILYSRNARVDDVKKFTERDCSRGGLGRFPAKEIMPLLLAHALKLEKYGA